MPIEVLPTADVIVVGGGPGGSTAASLIAKAGHRVSLFEKARFPRYQIGESLLLASWDLFDKLGGRQKIEAAGFVRKPGATFLWGLNQRPWSIYFAELGGRQKESRQVERSLFDQILLHRSRDLGVEVREESEVKELLWREGRVVGILLTHQGRTFRQEARYVVDASGRFSPLTKKLTQKVFPDDFRGAAVWTYYRGVKRLPSPDTGNILYAMFPWGWFWVIPLQHDMTSVGVVVNPPKFRVTSPSRDNREAYFKSAVDSCPLVQRMLASAEQISPFHACADYSQTSERFYGPGYLLVGDAACFVDPILSTGVHLAMQSGYMAALTLNTILAGGNEALALRTFEELYREEYEQMLRISREQYDINRSRRERFWRAHRILNTTKTSHSLRRARLDFIRLISGVAGDIHSTLRMQFRQNRKVSRKFGRERFRQKSFHGIRPRLSLHPLPIEPGYRIGANDRLTLLPCKVVRIPRGSQPAIGSADLKLLSLCDGRRTVQEIVGLYRNPDGNSSGVASQVKMAIGYWMEKGVLESTSLALKN